MTIAILVPVLRRPHRAAPLVESIEQTTPEPHRVVFICTEDDLYQQEAVVSTGAELLVLPGARLPGDYARKINLGYRETTEPLLFLAADDLRFHPGWIPKAVAHLDDCVGVVGTNDLTNRRTRHGHSTHSLVTRAYIDEFGTVDEPGKVLHEGYQHNFCDDELVQTAERRHAYVHAVDCHVEHLHPIGNKASFDEIYELGQVGFESDRTLFLRRQRLWT